jgi:hypothetical protein
MNIEDCCTYRASDCVFELLDGAVHGRFERSERYEDRAEMSTIIATAIMDCFYNLLDISADISSHLLQ